MTLPRDILTGKMPAVYNTIVSRGGVLIPMQQALDGDVRAHYPDGSTLAGTPSGVDFSYDGKIPRVASGSPVATFGDGTENVAFAVPAAGPLQMSTGGTFLALVTPGVPSGSAAYLIGKSTATGGGIRQGYGCFYRSTRTLSFASSNSTSGVSYFDTAPGVFEFGERFLYAATLDAAGNGKIYKNGELLKSSSNMSLPSNTAATLTLGNAPGAVRAPNGPYDFASMIPGVVLDAPQIQAVAAQCGPLG